MKTYKLETPCDSCPFSDDGPGLQLRLSFQPGRFAEIKLDLVKGGHFLCHKTITMEEDEDGNYVSDGTEKICAGAREYQRKLGIVSDCEQVMDRLLAMKKGKA